MMSELDTAIVVLPTLRAAAGHPAAYAEFDGANMWPMLTGTADVPAPDYVPHALGPTPSAASGSRRQGG